VTTTEQVIECADDIIYTGYKHINDPSKFSVTEVNNSTHVTRDLNISGTELTDAGVYLCAERVTGVAGVTDSSSAQLIVLGNAREVKVKGKGKRSIASPLRELTCHMGSHNYLPPGRGDMRKLRLIE